MVGFDDYLNQIMEDLTEQGPNRRVVAIAGMGGIGKTTLAKNVYVNPLIIQYFDFRAWATISQQYSVRDILSRLLSEIRGFPIELENHEDDELGGELYKELCGKRYLIVLDDMWSVEAWNGVKCYFPNNNNESRMMITTRITNLASDVGSCCLNVNFLDDDKSWNLFCKKAFGDEVGWPNLELEELGKMIAKKCKGLPMSIVTVAGLLAKFEKTTEYLEYVLENLNSIVTSDHNENCLKILSLSYSHLPIHLKPCFLYMGVFPEDHKVRVSKLVKLWVAEGFLKPNETQSLEDIAYDYLKDLVDRNLILVHTWTSRRKIKMCYIHDLLRDLCLKESQKEKFLFLDKGTENAEIVHRSKVKSVTKDKSFLDALKSPILTPKKEKLSTSQTRSFLSGITLFLKYALFHPWENVSSDGNLPSRHAIFHDINLCYLEFELFRSAVLPASTIRFWNLETLVICGDGQPIDLPDEIWGMKQLRHLICNKYAILTDPPGSQTDNHGSHLVLSNLQTVSSVLYVKLTDDYRRIPNVRKLKIHCSEYDKRSHCCVKNIHRLVKLESLHLSLDQCPHYARRQHISFPLSLKKLILKGGKYPWKSMRMIGSLPNLEVLKIWNLAFAGDEWIPIEGEFLSLRLLEIDYCPLKTWIADETSFPRLEHLGISDISRLEAIPFDIGNIPTLQSIYVDNCSQRVLGSAKQILEQQRSFGNDSLQVLTKYGPILLDESED